MLDHTRRNVFAIQWIRYMLQSESCWCGNTYMKMEWIPFTYSHERLSYHDISALVIRFWWMNADQNTPCFLVLRCTQSERTYDFHTCMILPYMIVANVCRPHEEPTDGDIIGLGGEKLWLLDCRIFYRHLPMKVIYNVMHILMKGVIWWRRAMKLWNTNIKKFLWLCYFMSFDDHLYVCKIIINIIIITFMLNSFDCS